MPRRQTARLLIEETAATESAAPALSLASGDERPVRSPALELQEALQEMLAARVAPQPQPSVTLAFGLGLISVAGVCAAFWIAVGRLVISLA
ncbi:hypothetical protein [Phenylobacterium sp.]|jgi:pyruvate-formate lyase|uniref:hypothetical protein n=1 Tax=Phenylobacterium sp. TaxID=1871053 RepID=UPI002F929112